MSKFTPGPWSFREPIVADDESFVVYADAYFVAEVPNVSRRRENVANALLIAAAPDLYRELNHAAALLAIAANTVRTVDFEGDRFDLLTEAERFDALLAKVDDFEKAARLMNETGQGEHMGVTK